MNEDIIKQRWQEIKEHIRDEYRLSDISYKTWIKNLEIEDIRDHVVHVRIPSNKSLMLSYIVDNFQVFFEIAITEMLNENYKVEFHLMEDNQKKEEEEKKPVSPVSSEQIENANLIPKYRFDTFIVGRNNNFAQSACVAVAESPGNTYNPLFLYGGAGLGKTHLMHSIGHYILEMNPSKRVLYVTSEQFTNEVIESIRSGNAASMARLRDKYRTVDVLLIDDIQFIIGKESTQEEFFHTFNELHQAGKQIVLSSDRPPREMETLDERFRSRFEWGLIADIQPPDYETRMAILRKNAEMTGRHLDDEILEYIATNIKSNIRELEGAFNRLIALSTLEKRPIDMLLAEEAIKDIISPGESRKVTPELIIEIVAEHFHITPADIYSNKRTANIAYPRQIAMYLCKENDTTLKKIGDIMGGRDHTTIMHGVEKIEKELQSNDSTIRTIGTIRKKINPN